MNYVLRFRDQPNPVRILYGRCTEPVRTLYGPVPILYGRCTAMYGRRTEPVRTLYGPCTDPVRTQGGYKIDPGGPGSIL